MREKTGGRSAERSAACSTCGKTFARSDTLLRHEKNHHTTDARGPLHRVTHGTFRACQACAAARSRCSGGSPCGRCSLRSLDCTYPNKRRKTLTVGKDTPGQRLVGQFKEIVFTTDEHNLLSSDVHSRSGTGPSPRHIAPRQPGQQDASGPLLLPTDQEIQPRSAESQTNLNAMHNPSQMMPVHDDHFGYNAVVAPHDPAFTGTKTPFDYTSFDEPLNWIPPSIYPSPYDAELEQDFSFILPALSETPNFDADYGMALSYDVAPQMPQETLDPQGMPPRLSNFGQSPASSASDGIYQTKSLNGMSTNSEFKRKKRKASTQVLDCFAQPRKSGTLYAFPEPIDSWVSFTSEIAPEYCSTSLYDTIFGWFQKLCLQDTMPAPFQLSSFPPCTVLNTCIALYFGNFHDNFPVIHQTSFGSESSWILTLAVATIGSTFARTSYTSDVAEAFQEFLRRAVDRYTDGAPDTALDLPFAQARILNLIGLVQSDREQLRSLSPRYHAGLSRWCLESGLLQLPATGHSSELQPNLHNIEYTLQGWQKWTRTESLRRVGYLSWMLDCALGYLANARPLCNMDDARTPLPCSESAWNASTLESWVTIVRDLPKMPSLCTALETMYNTKKVDAAYSDLSYVLLIHALYQRTWEVGTHIKQPLSEWVPTGKARGFLNTPSKDNFWLPLYPLYANWRNSACDCLDVIHWQAASVVAKASGIEHPLVLHLHLARIVLLTPFQEIQDLLLSLIGKVGSSPKASFYVHDGSYQPRNTAKLPQIRKITWRWLLEDQHKARLAMVHAGSVFWYVRRYSSTSFFEPIAVYLASLVLWTYGSYKSSALDRDAVANGVQRPEGGPSGPDAIAPIQRSRMERKEHPVKFVSKAHAAVQSGVQQTSPSEATSETSPVGNQPSSGAATRHSRISPEPTTDSDSDEETSSADEKPEFIHLDRPCDDEMVQHFVRHGEKMSGHMTNVGDICKTPQKVLLEGAKLLRTKLSAWGISREYYEILMKLAELRKAN